jgi:hypothetical protein
MNKMKGLFSVYVAVMMLFGGFALQISAQKNRNERDVRSILRSLDSKIDDLRYSLRYGLQNSRIDDQDARAVEDDLADLDAKVRDFGDNFNQRRENGDDVLDVLNSAKSLSDFLSANRINNTVQKDWTEIRGLLDRLALNYGIKWNWSTGNSLNNNKSNNSNSSGLNGTFQIDVSKSEKVDEIIENSDVQNESQRQDLEDKLTPADQIAIEIRGNQITLGSSNSSPISFLADGRTRNENSNGRTIRTRALLRGDELTVSSIGGESDLTIIFLSVDNGKSLKVTRRVTTDYLRQTVFADSFYDKTDSIARFDGTTYQNPTDSNNDNQTYSSNDPDDNPDSNYPTTNNSRTGNFIVPNGTIITGILENDFTTKVSQNNDRFRLTVQSPNEFRGAVIEGYISNVNRSGRATGRSQITFNFERITLRNGQTYDFAGNLKEVTDQTGKIIKIDNEGTTKGNSQTKETVKRGGIGAGAGALIGAIIGGAKGAAIGAIIGGGAGAGSVIVQGKDDLELKKGSTMTIQASSPNR